MLGAVDYKTLHAQFCHINELKQLVRYRDVKVKLQSKILVELTNILDQIFSEYKTFFNQRLAASVIFILKNFKSRSRIDKFQTKTL
jgi:hypothetical protein